MKKVSEEQRAKARQRAKIAYELKTGRKLGNIKMEIIDENGNPRDITARDLADSEVENYASSLMSYGMNATDAYRQAVSKVFDTKYTGDKTRVDTELVKRAKRYNKQIEKLVKSEVKAGMYTTEVDDPKKIREEEISRIAAKHHHLYKIDTTKVLNKEKVLASTRGGVKGVITRSDILFRKNFETNAMADYENALKSQGVSDEFASALVEILKDKSDRELQNAMTTLAKAQGGKDGGAFVNFFYQGTAQVQVDSVLTAFNIVDDDIVKKLETKGMDATTAESLVEDAKNRLNL